MTRKVVSEQSSLYGDVLIVLLVVSLSAIVPDGVRVLVGVGWCWCSSDINECDTSRSNTTTYNAEGSIFTALAKCELSMNSQSRRMGS